MRALLTIVLGGAALVIGVALGGLVLDQGPGVDLGPAVVGMAPAAMVVVGRLSRTRRRDGGASSGCAAATSSLPEGAPR